jgi:hypothetical protein
MGAGDWLLVTCDRLVVARHWHQASGIWYTFQEVVEESITKEGELK